MICSSCKRDKHLFEFNKNKSRKSGYCHICKMCRRVYYIENKKVVDEKQKKYDMNNKEKVQDKNKRYYQKTISKQKIKRKKHYIHNKEIYLQRNKIRHSNLVMISGVLYNVNSVDSSLRESITFLIAQRKLSKTLKKYKET